VRRPALAGGIATSLLVSILAITRLNRHRRRDGIGLRSRRSRNVELARLGANVGATYVTTNARKLFASAERREQLDRTLELRTAEAVADRLGQMKGILMKLGQMASYLDEGLPQPMRQMLSALQAQAPPMSAELAAQIITDELGVAPDQLFVEWDPIPIAAASIGQVHRALWIDPATGQERAVAVKVQYPGAEEAITSDLANSDLLGAILRQGFGGLDPTEMMSELRERFTEELDYRSEARNQTIFADYFVDHPFIHVPAVVSELSTAKVLTSELVEGASWSEIQSWDQHEKNLAAESIYRFVFRSLYGIRAFNGDPHPGNYLFHGGGRVTFLDFGLVKYFTAAEIHVFENMIDAAVIHVDDARFRHIVEEAGLLQKNAPISTDDAGEYFSLFYAQISGDQTMTWTPEYASSVVRHAFDRKAVIAQYATVPRSFVLIQRINMGLFAILGELRATGNYRRISEELWPMTKYPPSTRMGEAEGPWLAARNG
jgi:predicted unusual protein kinase regulating ubiquinone biosynthesis (AarF/ABC1/UbiB family)